MRNNYAAGCAVALLLMLAGCSETPPPADTSAADQKAIKDGETQWAADWTAKDADKLAGHYADHASLLMPDVPIATGKDSIRAALQGLLADPNLTVSFTLSTVATSKSGDLGYTQGSYIMTKTNPKTKRTETEQGKYVTVYQKQADGSWKAVEDISNADAPAVSDSARAASRKAAPAARRRARRK